jgi:hypothetical protein
MVEEIPPKGIIQDENNEILSYFPDFIPGKIRRISFWTSKFKHPNQRAIREDKCLGYAIIKHDQVASKPWDAWHVFEAVFIKFEDPHNAVPNSMKYDVALGWKKLTLKGILYAQQNTLNKTCAQVALRSVLSRIVGSEVSYREINDKARTVYGRNFSPSDGLDPEEIRAVLKGFNVGFVDYDYEAHTRTECRNHPYQRFIYQGIESGTGALLAFRLSGRGDNRHIVPFYGHTFNKDTWAPDAEAVYFRVGRGVGYIPSEHWANSFIGHDDNFGPNFCVPRLYVQKRQVKYTVELLKSGIVFGGVQAQALALQFLYSVLRKMSGDSHALSNIWLNRLVNNAVHQRIVLRAIPLDASTYLEHLANQKDWDGNYENKRTIDVFTKLLPNHLWIVELSIPQLFPANKRKLGDIVLNGGKPLQPDISSSFSFVRIPGRYYFQYSRKKGGKDFLMVPSQLTSHVPVLIL